MSFLRPEAAALIKRWLETALWSALTAAAVLWLLFASDLEAPWRWGLAALAALAGAGLARSAALSALGGVDGDAPGVVTIDERRIAYFGPREGGVASLNDIFAIELHGPSPDFREYETRWIFRWSETDPAVIIPASAKGADGMIDALSALPGFSPVRALGALASPPAGGVTIWRRDPAPERPALAPSPDEGLTKR